MRTDVSKLSQEKLMKLWREGTPEYREQQLELMREVLRNPDAQAGVGVYSPPFSYAQFQALVKWLTSWHKELSSRT